MAKIKFLALLSIGVMFAGIYVYNLIYQHPPLPDIKDIVWKQSKNLSDDAIYPFAISVSKQKLEYLKQRLQNTKYASPLQGANYQYGVNTIHLPTIIDYWANEYNWEERERLLNSVPHFRTQISGLNIHFIRIKPNFKRSDSKIIVPLLLLHGWPGSVREFYDVFTKLTTPRNEYDFVFEVVAPSLPGYGFSDAATLPGLNTAQIALIMKKLMSRLGFEKFYVQGGDWGAAIGSNLITIFPDSVIGFHSNLCYVDLASPIPFFKLILGKYFPKMILSDDELNTKPNIYPLADFLHFMLAETGYLHLQSTKPDTVGIALEDSPAGLAAYILEKFSTWTNPNWRNLPDGGLKIKPSIERKYVIDDLLDNVMIYWITNSITTSMRLYAESFSRKFLALEIDKIPTTVPVVCAQYPNEFLRIPESILRHKYVNLLHISHPLRGGHFAAFEEPALFAEDVWSGFFALRKKASNTKNLS